MNTQSLNFGHMNDKAVSWFHRLNDFSEEQGFSKSEDEPVGQGGFMICQDHYQTDEMYICLLIDSVMMGFYTQDTMLAFEALLRARYYQGNLEGMEVKLNLELRDAVRELNYQVQTRIQNLISGHKLTMKFFTENFNKNLTQV